ncbi:DUF6252 family protein [Hymenobacter sp. DH14]|uniref:DUF6252 family protein n=2 Tax=Hymenobacter cyanobacteriorum TaxID=2926463 RepID=A0A9X1VFV2_9BACT|nr:DUF6252 family protein [Hymenobacter cyanobacteriorum]
MRTYPFRCLAAVLLLAAGCKRPRGGPAAGHAGRQKHGRLPGQRRAVCRYWLGGDLLSNPTPPLSGGFYEDSLYYLTLSGTTSRGNTHVYLFFRSQKSGKYAFNQSTPSLDRGGLSHTLNYAACSFAGSNELYITDARHTGRVIVTANSNSGISAGTFEFTAASTFDPSKTITVTKGRFDRQQ